MQYVLEAKVVVLGHTGVGKTSSSCNTQPSQDDRLEGRSLAECISKLTRFPSSLLSVLNQFVRGQFAHTTATIGAAFMRKTVQIGQWAVQLQIWDTAGQERFRSLGSMYYKGARAAVLVYDVSSPATLQKVHSWVEELQAHTATGEDEDLVMVIAANKGDLLEQKTPQELKEFVDQDEAGEYAASIGQWKRSAATAQLLLDFTHWPSLFLSPLQTPTSSSPPRSPAST
jgi:small GTP-binding protein